MILIASTSTHLLDLFGSERFMHRTWSAVSTCDALLDALQSLKPDIVLLDAALSGLMHGPALQRLADKCRASKLIVLHRAADDETELEFFRYANARGSCLIDSDADILQRTIAAVERGEVWIKRRLIAKLIEEQAQLRREQQCHPKSRQRVELTRREREIALLVCAGNSNKQIARLLCITERTVKAHLSEIFRKMDITDRLTLALRLSRSMERARELPQSEQVRALPPPPQLHSHPIRCV